MIITYFASFVIDINYLSYAETEYLKLEDIIDAYRFPSVMDVKMGCRTWTETSTSAKIQKEKLKFPHGEALGFRIFGMKVSKISAAKSLSLHILLIQVYNPDDDDYKIKDKYWGRQITPGTVLECRKKA